MTEIRIHKVISGPYEEDDGSWFIEAYVDVDDNYHDATVWFLDFDDAYDVIKHMSSPTLEPYVLEQVEE